MGYSGAFIIFIIVGSLVVGLVLALTMLSQSRHAAHVRAGVLTMWRVIAVLTSAGLVLLGGVSLMGDNIRGLFATSTCYAMAGVESSRSSVGRAHDRVRALGRVIGAEVKQVVEPLIPCWLQQLDATGRDEAPVPAATPPARQPQQPMGPSCRLHPRVLRKVLRSIEQDRRDALDS